MKGRPHLPFLPILGVESWNSWGISWPGRARPQLCAQQGPFLSPLSPCRTAHKGGVNQDTITRRLHHTPLTVSWQNMGHLERRRPNRPTCVCTAAAAATVPFCLIPHRDPFFASFLGPSGADKTLQMWLLAFSPLLTLHTSESLLPLTGHTFCRSPAEHCGSPGKPSSGRQVSTLLLPLILLPGPPLSSDPGWIWSIYLSSLSSRDTTSMK